jgi:HAD superfamily hydrolase (TIGR01662 family)
MPEVHLIIGPPASGKTDETEQFVKEGCVRISRDKTGGLVADLVPKVEVTLKRGKSVVMDNTFPTAESRVQFVKAANALGADVHAHLMMTSIEDAQINALHRMWQRYKQVFLTQDEINSHPRAKKDPNIFPSAVLFKYRKMFEKPTAAEGFASIRKIKFVRRPLGPEYCNGAVIFDYDSTLRRSKSGGKWPESVNDVELLPGRREVVRHLKHTGHLLLGVSNQSAIAKGLSEQVAIACFEKTNKLLGADIEYHYCPHRVPPVSCYCRKPQSGLGVMLIEKHKLNPAECTYVGDAGTDRTFAARLGFRFAHADDYF